MRHKISKDCQQMIKNILKLKAEHRPSVEQILKSDYVRLMATKFGWDLAQLLRFRKMKNRNIKASLISSYQNSHQALSKMDSFNYEKPISVTTNNIKPKDSVHFNEKTIKKINKEKKLRLKIKDELTEESIPTIMINNLKSQNTYNFRESNNRDNSINSGNIKKLDFQKIFINSQRSPKSTFRSELSIKESFSKINPNYESANVKGNYIFVLFIV